MLTFEQKQAIIEEFSQLTKKEISLKRINYHFEGSLYEKTIVVEKLHPNGNGFVFVGDLLKYEKEANDNGLVNIRDYSERHYAKLLQTQSSTYQRKLMMSRSLKLGQTESDTT